jgi:hypothetical protein
MINNPKVCNVIHKHHTVDVCMFNPNDTLHSMAFARSLEQELCDTSWLHDQDASSLMKQPPMQLQL